MSHSRGESRTTARRGRLAGTRAETAMSQSTEQQAFLLALSDTLRPLADASEIQATTTRLLGTYLGADRSMYAEVEGALGAEVGTVRGQYVRLADGGDAPIVPFPERFTYTSFGARTMAGRRRGDLLVVTDVDADPTFEAAERAAWAAAGVRAAVVAPLVKGGRLVAEFGVQSAAPRAWTAAEVALVQDVAERTWAAAERARAEAALRTNQQRLRAQKEAFEAAIDGLPLEACLGILARLVTDELQGEARTQFYMADPDGLHLHAIRGAGNMPDAYLDLVDGFLIGADSLACGLSTATARPVLTRDVFEEPLWQPWVHIAVAHDYRGCWSFPIATREGRTVGTFALYFRAAREPAPHERALADLVTQTAAIIIARHTEAQERARAEAALRRGEQRLRTATSAARISTFEIDVASGMVEFDPNVLAVLYGSETNRIDLGPQDWAPLVQAWLRPKDAQRHTELLRATMRGEGDLHNELLVRDPATGAETWIEAQASLVRDGAGGPERVFGIMRNITQRKQTEEALRHSDAKYRSLFESIDEAFCVIELIHDEADRAVDLRYVEVNEALERQTGLSGIAGKLLSEVVPGTESYWFETYDEVARTGQAKRFEDHHQDTGRWYDVYASRVGQAGSRQVAVVFKDVTERKEREERQRFLLQLSDAVRPLVDPVEIMAAVSEAVGRHFHVGRCGYAEVPPPYDHLVVARDWTNGVMDSLQGSWPLASFGEAIIAEYRSGKTVVYEDVFDDDRVRGYEAGVAAAGMLRSGIAVQSMKGGEWVATFYVQDTSARRWTRNEIALMEDIAERTWAAVERARAEAALRESERRYRLLFENMGEGFALAEMIWDADGRPADWRYLEVNDAWAQTGVSVSHTVGRTAREVNPEIEPYWIETYGRAVQTGQPVKSEAYARGLGKWFETLAFPHSENRFGLIFRDVTKRVDSAAALRASEARYRTLFESIDEGFVIAEVVYDVEGRPADALYLEGNPAASRLTGIPDYSRRLFSEVMPGAEPYWVEIYDRVARTGVAERLERYLAPIQRWYNFHVSRVTDAEHEGSEGDRARVAIVFQDVTERRAAVDALRASEARLQLALDAAEMGTFVWTPDGDRSDADARTLALYGLDPNDPLNHARALDEFVIPEDRAAYVAKVAHALDPAGDGVLRSDYRIRRADDGAERWIATLAQTQFAGEPPVAVSITGVSADITERKGAEIALRESEERLRRILDSETVGVVFFNWESTVLDANTAFWQMTGYTAADANDGALSWRTMTPPEWVETSEAQMAALAATGRIGPYEKEYQRKDGTRLWLMFAGRDLGDGTIVEFVIDVSDRKQLEAERERLLVAEAVATERQALLKHIVRAQEEERARVAREVHDSVTQLAHAAAIHLDNAVEALDGTPMPARGEIERGRDLTRQVANEARRLIAELRPQVLDLAGLSGAIEAEAENLRRAGWDVDVFDGDLLGVRLDPEVEITLFRVAQEALSNIRKHAGAGKVRVHLRRDRGNLRLEVRDWGRGFDPKAVRVSAEGEHVGLTGMRERMHLVGGQLEIRSRPGGGTTVRATLAIPSEPANGV